MTAALAAALLAAMPALSQEAFQVRRGDIEVRVRVIGTVVPDEVFRVKAAAAARVEEIRVSTGSWVKAKQTLGLLADTEMAAIRDSQGTTPQDTVEERWKKVYRPAEIQSPADCFLLTAYVKPKQWVKPQAVLFEAAKTLRLVGRVRPEDVQWIENGQRLEFWATKDPARKLEARIARYDLDPPGQGSRPGGSFTMAFSPKDYLPPGTSWEGIIIPAKREGVLTVPTGALIRHGDEVYLPVKVSTGITTDALTEIQEGAEEGRRILVLDDARLKEARRHRPPADLEALRRRLSEEAAQETRAPRPAPEERRRPEPEKAKELAEPGVDYGEDPYSQ